MNPLKINNSEDFVNFIDSFETQIRENRFQKSINKAYENFLKSDADHEDCPDCLGFEKIISKIGVLPLKIIESLGDLKLQLATPSPSNPPVSARKWMHEKAKLITEDCKNLSLIIAQLNSIEDASEPEKEFSKTLKELYIAKMKEFAELINEPLLEEKELFDLVLNSFEQCEQHLSKIQNHYLKILEIEEELEPLEVNLEFKSCMHPSIQPLALQRFALSKQMLLLDGESQALLNTLKQKCLEQALSEKRLLSSTEKRTTNYLKKLQENFFSYTRQGIENEKIRKHREIRIVTKDIHRKVQNEGNKENPHWSITPWGRVLCEGADGEKTSLQKIKDKYNTSASLFNFITKIFTESDGLTPKQFTEKITALKVLKRDVKQQLEVLRQEQVNINNINSEETKAKIISLELVEKQHSMSIYQCFLNRLIDLTSQAKLQVRKTKEQIALREVEVNGFRTLQQYVQKLVKIEEALPETVKKDYKKQSSDYIAMLSSKLEATYEPIFNQKVMACFEKFDQPLASIPGLLEGEIQKLLHKNEIDELQIEACNFRAKALNSAFDSTIVKYQNAYNSTREVDVAKAFFYWCKDTFLHVTTLGYWKPTNLTPSEFFQRKDLADMGYDMIYDCQKLLLSLKAKPGQTWQDPFKELINDFINWASEHPTAAAGMASDMAQLIAVFSDKNVALRFASVLKANVFMTAVLGALGRPIKEMPDKENELRFRAASQLLKFGPVWMRGVNAGVSLFNNFDSKNIITSVVSSLLNSIGSGFVDQAMRDMINTIPNAWKVFGLQVARVIANIVHGQAYMDSVAERQKVEFINNTSQYAQLLLRPNSLKNKLLQWYQVISAATGKEKIYRLASSVGIVLGGASLVAPFSMLVIGFLGPFGLIPAAAATVAVLFYSFKKALQVNELLDDVFPNTFETVRRQEASRLFDLNRKQIKQRMKENIQDLQRRGIIPEKVHYDESLSNCMNNIGFLEIRRLQQLEFTRKLELAEKMDLDNKGPATFRENYMKTQKVVTLSPNDYLSIFNAQLLKPDYKTECMEKLKEVFSADPRVTESDIHNLATSMLNENILQCANGWLRQKLLLSYKEHFIENYINYKVSPYRPAYHLPNDNEDPDQLLENMLWAEVAKLNGNLAVNQDQQILRLVLKTYITNAKDNMTTYRRK